MDTDVLLIPAATGSVDAFPLVECVTDDEVDAERRNQRGEEFDELSRRVAHAWVERLTKKRKAGWNDWLERLTYDLIHSGVMRELSEPGLKKMFRRRIERHGRGRRGIGISDNLFSLALLALFAHEKRGPTTKQRHKMSSFLMTAYRHYVPPVFLRGFSGQLSLATPSPAENRMTILKGFEDWIVQQRVIERLLCSEPRKRGPYPEKVKKRVKAVVRRVDMSQQDAWSEVTVLEHILRQGLNSFAWQ